MNRRRDAKVAATLIAIAMIAAGAPPTRAQDLLSGLFGALVPRPPVLPSPAPAMSYGGPTDEARALAPPRLLGGGRAAFCVRGCDGRYFPLPPTEGENAAAVCSSFCPAGATRVVYGSDIDSATTSSGQAYSELPNAFRYRNELVAGCTCNGKDPVGLARMKIEDDHTLRKGDIVAGAGGLLVAGGRVDRKRTANFTPAPASIRSKFERMPVVASQ